MTCITMAPWLAKFAKPGPIAPRQAEDPGAGVLKPAGNGLAQNLQEH
jgi:hypothetical protein